jgi:hypothetical protein
MEIQIDPDVEKVVRFIESEFPSYMRRPIAEQLAHLAYLIWPGEWRIFTFDQAENLTHKSREGGTPGTHISQPESGDCGS